MNKNYIFFTFFLGIIFQVDGQEVADNTALVEQHNLLARLCTDDIPDLNAVKDLLEQKVPTELAGDTPGISYNAAPLAIASGRGEARLVALLLQYNAEVDVRDPIYEKTPLMFAATDGHTEIINLLLQKGAAINAINNVGFTALTFAAFFANVKAVQALLAGGANVTIENKFGQTALDCAEQQVVDGRCMEYAKIVAILSKLQNIN